MTPPKEHNNFPVTISKERNIYGWLDKEFTIIVLKEALAVDSMGKQKKMKLRKGHMNKTRSSIQR